MIPDDNESWGFAGFINTRRGKRLPPQGSAYSKISILRKVMPQYKIVASRTGVEPVLPP